MIIGLLAFVITTIGATIAGVLFWYATAYRQKDKNVRALLAFGIIVATGGTLLVPSGKLVLLLSARQGRNVSLGSYRGDGPQLPKNTRDISYFSSYQGTEATFFLREDEFVDWIKTSGWKSIEIFHKERILFNNLKVTDEIDNGVVVDEVFHPRGTGVRIVYDRRTGRCFYRYSSY